MILSYLRTIVLYLVLIVVIRLMGKRQIGQMEPAEFVVTMLVANLAAVPMQDGGIPLYAGLVPILTVLGLELILSHLSLKSLGFRKLLCGKPVILVENGKILQENLRRTGLTIDELTSHLRRNQVLDPRKVRYAILETDGTMSVFPDPKELPAPARDAGIRVGEEFLPVTLVADGRVMAENLASMGKDGAWLQQQLRDRQARLEETWLLTLDSRGHTIFYRKEGA